MRIDNDRQIPSEVAAMLAGRRVLIIGGDCRPEQLRRLQAAFPTTEFIWRSTRQSDASLDAFEHLVARSDVAMVIVLHGLARTAHTKGTRRLCSGIHKPLLWCRRPTVAAVVRALTGPRVAA
ncbi:MAG: hypothetical protein AB7K52_15435 [Phycisphaerales bacterium]